MTPLQKYQADLKRDDFSYDAAQEQAVQHLDLLFHDFNRWQQQKPSLLQRLQGVKHLPPVQGLYFWGGVGRGKTYLVDTFFEALPTERKLRTHFHRFMHKVHQELKALPGVKNPLTVVAERFKAQTDIICFDEFFVSDITDAMLLAGLLEELFRRGICLVATSNIVPDELYRNGLQRARFLPAIALVKQHCKVVNVDSGVDYRLRTLEQAEIYHSPLDTDADVNLLRYFVQLAPEPRQQDIEIEIENRKIAARFEADGVLFCSFAQLCETMRSQVDYIELSRIYHTVLLSGVKQMGQGNDDAARRFLALVDEFYERNVKLIISAEVSLAEIYSQGQLSFEFARCRSRLMEMQSTEYLARPHLP